MVAIEQLFTEKNVGIGLYVIVGFTFYMLFRKIREKQVMTVKESIAYWILGIIIVSSGLAGILGMTSINAKIIALHIPMRVIWIIAVLLFIYLTLKIRARFAQRKIAMLN